MSNSHFQIGHGVYDCVSCGRKTRGDRDSIGTDMCGQCFFLFGDDNMHNDYGTTPSADEMLTYNKLLEEIRERGGDAEKVRGYCGYLWTEEVQS